MPTVVGIRLRFSKTLWFDPAGTEPVMGDIVIVETERGTESGTVVQPPHEVADDQLVAPLKPVVRIADESDLAHFDELEAKEREAMPVFRELVEGFKLDMKPIDVEYLPTGDKIVFYFSAEERVDFRELVKELASRFHARIDMRQVGVRDEARMVGGVGHCGQMLCCVRFGGEFQPVSIRMAKEQDLPLNPLKISGLCGRLMCCLRYEFDAYKDFKGRAPKRGAIIDTPVGPAKVIEFNTPREMITLRFEDGSRTTVPLSGMSCAKGSGCPCHVSQDALEEAGNAAAAAMAVTIQSVPDLETVSPKRQPRKERRDRPEGGRGKGGERTDERKRTQQPPAAEDEAAGKEGSGRRRRRRRSGGATAENGVEASQEPKTQPAKQAPKAQPAKQGEADGDKPSAGRKRRRRRRPSGGSGGDANAS